MVRRATLDPMSIAGNLMVFRFQEGRSKERRSKQAECRSGVDRLCRDIIYYVRTFRRNVLQQCLPLGIRLFKACGHNRLCSYKGCFLLLPFAFYRILYSLILSFPMFVIYLNNAFRVFIFCPLLTDCSFIDNQYVTNGLSIHVLFRCERPSFGV